MPFLLLLFVFCSTGCCVLFHPKGQRKCVYGQNSFILYFLLDYDAFVSCLFALRPEFLFLPCGPVG